MGAVVAKLEFNSYLRERKEVRRELIFRFIDNPKNKKILEDIRDVRTLVIKDKELCATAYKEAQYKYDVSPTCLESAQFELKRLVDLYNTGKHLKSAKARDNGFVACPYGHICSKFDNAEDIKCKICNINCDLEKGGYWCSYCEYTMCHICSVIYCAEGHAMKLWTLGEGDYVCSVCKQDPINSGFK